VSQRRVAVEQSTESVGKCDALFLGFARGVAHAINKRHVGLVQKVGGDFDGFIDGRFLPVNERSGVFLLGRVIQEPSASQHTSAFRLVNAKFIRVEFDIVTNATAKRTGGVGDDFEIRIARRSLVSAVVYHDVSVLVGFP